MAEGVGDVAVLFGPLANDRVRLGGAAFGEVAPEDDAERGVRGAEGVGGLVGGQLAELAVAPVGDELAKGFGGLVAGGVGGVGVGGDNGVDGANQCVLRHPAFEFDAVDEDHGGEIEAEVAGFLAIGVDACERFRGVHLFEEAVGVIAETADGVGEFLGFLEYAAAIEEPVVHFPEAVIAVEDAGGFGGAGGPAGVGVEVDVQLGVAVGAEGEVLHRDGDAGVLLRGIENLGDLLLDAVAIGALEVGDEDDADGGFRGAAQIAAGEPGSGGFRGGGRGGGGPGGRRAG